MITNTNNDQDTETSQPSASSLIKMSKGQLECLVDIIDIVLDDLATLIDQCDCNTGSPIVRCGESDPEGGCTSLIATSSALRDAQYKVFLSHKFGDYINFNRIDLETIACAVSDFIDQREEDQDHNFSSWEIVLEVHHVLCVALRVSDNT